MMTARSDVPCPNEWTSSDLDRLPEDGVRREIHDGVLHVTPSPSPAHQTLAMLLGTALIRSCPPHLFVSQAVDVELGPKRVFVPDLVVTTLEAARTKRKFAAADLVLAAEIVSPSTRKMDSLTKPMFYGKAGVPFYWLVDLEGGLSVTAYELDRVEGVYEQMGTFAGDETVRVERPWVMEIPLDAVRPRNL